MPTIHSNFFDFDEELPERIVQRLRYTGFVSPAASPVATKLFIDFADDWTPSECVDSITSYYQGTPSFVADFCTSYPRLSEMSTDGETALTIAGASRFPPSLESLAVNLDSPAAATALVAALGSHGSTGLPGLRAVHLEVVEGTGAVDITPLVAFAPTLTSLKVEYVVEVSGGWTRPGDPSNVAEETPRLEAALSQLTALRDIEMPALPTPRCFLAGRHAKLRSLQIGGSMREHFAALVRACPRLVRAQSCAEPVSDVPIGWERDGPNALARSSFCR